MRLKITGFIDLEDLDSSDVDPTHPSGLSSQGYESLMTGQGLGRFGFAKGLDEVETELVQD